MPGFVADITVEGCQNYLDRHGLDLRGKILPEDYVVVNSLWGLFFEKVENGFGLKGIIVCGEQSASPRTEKRVVTMRAASLFLVKVLILAGVLWFLGIALHETGHLIVAWVTGTHVESFRFYDPRFGGSVVQISGDISPIVLRVGDFAGGLFSGLVLLGSGFLLRKRFGKSALWWIAGLAIAEAGLMEISMGLTEGLARDGYCCTPAWTWGPADTAMLSGLVAGIGFYLLAQRKAGRAILERGP
jgi:hypothetical protein